MTSRMLDKQTFLTVVEHAPLIAIDLVVCSGKLMLMGERINQPAAGYWFVPGGRIFKNETLPEAFQRISSAELGMVCEIDDARLLGAFTHIYDNNFAEVAGISTHYVVLAYRLDLDLNLSGLPKLQHQAYQWLAANNQLKVHPNSQTYFDYLN